MVITAMMVIIAVLVVTVLVVTMLVVTLLVMTVARQMREMRGDFVLDPLLDVVSVNVEMLVIFLNVDDLDRHWMMHLMMVRPGVCGMRNRLSVLTSKAIVRV